MKPIIKQKTEKENGIIREGLNALAYGSVCCFGAYQEKDCTNQKRMHRHLVYSYTNQHENLMMSTRFKVVLLNGGIRSILKNCAELYVNTLNGVDITPYYLRWMKRRLTNILNWLNRILFHIVSRQRISKPRIRC